VADTYTLDALPRSVVGKKVRQLRVQGLVPAVIYGAKINSVSVQIPYRPLEVALRQAGGTHLININLDGTTHTVITRQVQRDILRGTIAHVDFLAVSADTLISAEVPVQFVGESPAVESRLGVLNTLLNSIEIEALPADLIDRIEVDLSALVNVGDSIHVRDLSFPERVQVNIDPDTMVARVSPLVVVTEEEEEAETTEPTSAEPEVIQKGKIEEEEVE
jgi:large subunit ribosomal protein L25